MAYKHSADGDTIIVEAANFRTYFEYTEVRDVILGKAVGRIDDIISQDFGISDKKGVLDALAFYRCSPKQAQESAVIRRVFITSEPQCEDSGESFMSRVDFKEFNDYLAGIRSPYDPDIVNAIIDGVQNATYEGRAELSLEQMQEILLFGTLFALVPRAPEIEDLAHLQMYLELDSTQVLQGILKYHRELDVVESPTELPCFMGAGGKSMFPLKLVRIRNILEKPVLVTLKKCPLRRTLPPKTQLLVLVTHQGEVVTFLPGICMAYGQVIYQVGGNLLAKGDGQEDTLSLPSEDSVFFSESEKYGFLIADKDGQFQGTNFSGTKPGKPVCWLKGDLENYGFLLSDGNYVGLEGYGAWNSLLFFDLGGGNAIATAASRAAIDNNGITLKRNIAQVSCYDQNYILLRMNGSVVTDLGEFPISGPARAVCACAKGYWISTDKGLLYYDGQERKLIQLPEGQTVEELARDCEGISVCYRTSGNEIRILR